jgi:hypothetical protein
MEERTRHSKVDRLVPAQADKRLYSVLKVSALGVRIRTRKTLIFEVIESHLGL